MENSFSRNGDRCVSGSVPQDVQPFEVVGVSSWTSSGLFQVVSPYQGLGEFPHQIHQSQENSQAEVILGSVCPILSPLQQELSSCDSFSFEDLLMCPTVPDVGCMSHHVWNLTHVQFLSSGPCQDPIPVSSGPCLFLIMTLLLTGFLHQLWHQK